MDSSTQFVYNVFEATRCPIYSHKEKYWYVSIIIDLSHHIFYKVSFNLQQFSKKVNSFSYLSCICSQLKPIMESWLTLYPEPWFADCDWLHCIHFIHLLLLFQLSFIYLSFN